MVQNHCNNNLPKLWPTNRVEDRELHKKNDILVICDRFETGSQTELEMTDIRRETG